jgi:hypothetical protein
VGSESTRPFAKIDVEEMRASLPGISGGALKVWLAYKLRANQDGVAWPGTKVLAADTGMSASRASKLRNELLRDGWLVAVGCVRGKSGTFAAPRFRPVIPQVHRTAKTAHGENTARREPESPRGENDSHRTAKMTHEVVPLKKNPIEVDGVATAPRGAGDFENLKTTDRVKKFLGWWSEVYRETYRTDPTISYARELKRLGSIFAKNPDDTIKSAARAYLGERSDFTVGHPLGKFVSQFDRWRALASPPSDDDGDETMPTVEDNRPPDYEETQEKIRRERERKTAASC